MNSAFRYSLAAASLLALTAARADAPAQRAFMDLALSPDGGKLVSVEGDQPAAGGSPVVRALMLRSLPDGKPTPIALPCGQAPQCWPASPVWSPDGKTLSFTLRKPGTHHRSVYQYDAASGALKEALSFNGTIIGLKYSKDGQLSMLATENAAKEIGAVEAGVPMAGDIDQKIVEQRIGILDKGVVRWMSPADLFVYEYDWRPDGKGFVGTAAPGDGDNNWWVAKLYAFDGKAAKVIHQPADMQHQIAEPKVSADGKRAFFISGIMSDFGSTGGDVYAVPLAGGAAVNLTPDMPASARGIDIDCDGNLVAELLRGDKTELADLGHGDQVAPPKTLWSGQESFSLKQADTACKAKGLQAVVKQSATKAPEIALGQPGKWADLTHDNAGLTTQISVQSVSWTNDGYNVQGWLMLPANFDKAKKLPMITIVHGGPSAAATVHFPAPREREFVASGYALFFPNPRGSFGQGVKFQAANVKDFGYGDLRDILAGIDAVEKIAPIDEARLGVMGHSYGGYMTMWTVTQTNRFKAAVASAGLSNWQSYYGENGIDQWMIPFFGKSVYDDPQIYARSSPMTFIKQVKTPTFMWVGDSDVEVPAPQTQEFWHALHALDVPTSMMIYQGEGHAMRDPAHIADAQKRTIEWFNKYLKKPQS